MERPGGDVFQGWIRKLIGDPRGFRTALNAAVRSAIFVQRQEGQRHQWSKKLDFIIAGTIAAAPPPPPPASFLCYECGYTHPSLRQLRIHRTKYHKSQDTPELCVVGH
eukprot:8844321-Pyramimonas_sp.AAC.1